MPSKEAELHGLDYVCFEDDKGFPIYKSEDTKYTYCLYSQKKGKDYLVYLIIVNKLTNIRITFSNEKVVKLWDVLCKWEIEQTENMEKEFEFLDA